MDFGLIGLLRFGDGGWGDELAVGVLGTLKLAIATLPMSLVAGFALALAKRSQEPTWRLFGNLVTTILRGLPELVTVILVFTLGQMLMREAGRSLGIGDLDISAFTAGVVALTIVFAAYSSEVFLGAMNGVDDTLVDAARALGLRRWPTLRFVVLPEILRLSMPGLSNLWLSLIKQTSIVSTLSYAELVQQGSIAAAGTNQRIFFFGVIFLLYLALSALSVAVLQRLEQRLDVGRAR